jgi:hypothetical protein
VSRPAPVDPAPGCPDPNHDPELHRTFREAQRDRRPADPAQVHAGPRPHDQAGADAGGTDASRWRTRIVRRENVDPRSLAAHPDNFKAHPDHQRAAIGSALDEIGWLGEILVSDLSGRILDGHMRVGEAVAAGQPTVPVAFVDCADEAEELQVLATFDPIGQLAQQDADKLGKLAGRSRIKGDPLLRMLAGLAGTRPPEPREEPSGRVVGSAFGQQGGRVPGGHVGKLPEEVWPVVVECQDAFQQARFVEQMDGDGYGAYPLEPVPSSLAERRAGREEGGA